MTATKPRPGQMPSFVPLGRGFDIMAGGPEASGIGSFRMPSTVRDGGRLTPNNRHPRYEVFATLYSQANPFMRVLPEATFKRGSILFTTRHDDRDVGGSWVMTLPMVNTMLRAGFERMRANLMRMIEFGRADPTGRQTESGKLSLAQYLGAGESFQNRLPTRDPVVGMFEQMFTADDIAEKINLLGLYQDDVVLSKPRMDKIYENTDYHRYGRHIVYQARGVHYDIPNISLGRKFDTVFVTLTRDQPVFTADDDLTFEKWGPYQFRVISSHRACPAMNAESRNVHVKMVDNFTSQLNTGAITPGNSYFNALCAPPLHAEALGLDPNPVNSSVGHWNLAFDLYSERTAAGDYRTKIKIAQYWEYPPVWRLGTIISETTHVDYYGSQQELEDIYTKPNQDTTWKFFTSNCDLKIDVERVV